jgi:hypothetical protein
MSKYEITTTDTQDLELDYLAGTSATKEQTVQALLDQKLADLYPGFLAWQNSETWRKLQKIEASDKEALDAAIAKVDAAERAEKEAEAQARLDESLGEGKP